MHNKLEFVDKHDSNIQTYINIWKNVYKYSRKNWELHENQSFAHAYESIGKIGIQEQISLASFLIYTNA